MRALAQRSAEAAEEIKSLISTSSAEVGQGVELVGLTGKALEKIVTHVVDLEAAVSNITARAMEQASSLQDIQEVVHQIDRNTQTNAAMAEETMRASATLQQEAKELAHMISGFRVGHAFSRPAAPPEKIQRPVVALRTTGRGGAVPAENPDWEEF